MLSISNFIKSAHLVRSLALNKRFITATRLKIPTRSLPQLDAKICCYSTTQQQQQADGNRQIQIKIIPAKKPDDSTYEERNTRKARELSPHLSIYRPQLTSIMSIMLRGTGFILTIMVWTIGLVGLICSHDIDDYAHVVESHGFKSFIFTIGKFFLALPFSYHLCNGARHLIWQLGFLLTKSQIYISGYITIVLTLILAGVLAVMNLKGKEPAAKEFTCTAEQMERIRKERAMETSKEKKEEDS